MIHNYTIHSPNNMTMTDAQYCMLCMDINCDGCPYVSKENRWGKAIFKEIQKENGTGR